MRSLKARLLVFVGVIVLVFSAISIQHHYSMITFHVKEYIHQQVSLAFSFVLASRDYVTERVRPIMYDLVDENDFIPESMSSSFVARHIFENVRENFPDYIIKFSAINPRNPVNKAGPGEEEMIRYFNDNPSETIWTGEISLAGKQYYANFGAMRMETKCLRCHGNPSDAPDKLLDIYGSSAGFHLPLGKVVGLDTVGIPTDRIRELLWSELVEHSVVLGTTLVFLFLSLTFVCKFLITNRLGTIAKHFEGAATQEEGILIEAIEVGGKDEISSVANSFNVLAKKINDAHGLLEDKVAQSTGELRLSNERLRIEIENQKASQKKLRSLASALSLAEQRERRRIATEVHDRIGQNLALLRIKLGEMRKANPESYLLELIELLDDAIRDVRSLVSEISSPVLYELGFVPAVRQLTKKMGEQQGIDLHFQNDGKPKSISDDVQVLLFQAVRELLVNVAKHSNASRGTVSVSREGDSVRIDVKDDGVGFDTSTVDPSASENAGFGLFSIRERLEPLGGSLEVSSTPGEGSTVTLFAPLEK